MKLSSFLFLIGLMVTLACNSDDPDMGPGIWIRVENASEFRYDNVVVETQGGENNYGTINVGEKSDYKVFELAYRYAFVQLQIDSDTFTLQPIDYVGETPLEEGNYTYVVDASQSESQFGRLSISLVED